VSWNEVRIEIDPQDTAGSFRLRTPDWTMAGITTDVEGHRFLVLQRFETGTGIENVEIEGPQGRGRLGIISVHLSGFQQVKVTSQPTFLPIEISPPGAGPISSVMRYDRNNNRRIDDAEFFAVIDAWIANQISNELFFQAIDLWISQSPISSAGLRVEPRKRSSRKALVDGPGVVFLAQSPEVASMSVEIFDLSGRLLFSQWAPGSRLVWRWGELESSRRANGLYLYRVSSLTSYGQMIENEWKKFVIVR